MTKLDLAILALAAYLLASWVAAVPAVGETPDSVLDPVVAEVLEMLEAGVSEDLIRSWLDSTGRQPAEVTSTGVIALTGAGASDAFVEALLGLAGEPGAAVEEMVAVEEAADAGKPVEARFLIRAKDLFTDEPEPDDPPPAPWDMYVYLDGEYLGWVTPSLDGEPADVRRLLSGGEHVLRVVLQRFDPKSRRYRYDSLSVPVAVTFTATVGDPLEIEVEMKRIWGLWRDRKTGGAFSYRVRQGVEVLTENDGTGGDPDRWRPLCEDVKANFPDKEKVPGIHSGDMARCIPWNELWADFGVATSREQILEMIDSYEGRPPLRSF